MATKRPFLAISGIQIPSTGVLNITNTTASIGATSGALTVSGGVGIGNSLSISGSINLFNGNFYTALVSSASSNSLYTLPSSVPSTGTSVLQSDVSGNLSWVPMTATASGGSGISSLNSLQVGTQFLVVGTAGSIFNISSSGSTHTFNIPIAGLASTGLITTNSQTIAGQKTFTSAIVGDLIGTATTSGFATTASYSYQSGYGLTSGLATTALYSHQSGYAITSSSSGLATTSTYSHQSGYAITSSSSGTAITATYSHQSGYAITSGSSTTSGFATTSAYAYQSGYGITAGIATTSTYSHQSGYATTSGFATTSTYSHQSGYAITSISSGTATTSTYSHQSGYGSTAGFATTANYSYQSGYGLTSGLATTSTYSLQSGYGITSGTATTSTNINVVSATSNSIHRVLFTPSTGTASGAAVSTESSFVYNPFTDILSVSGLAVTSSLASTSTSTGSLIVSGGTGIQGALNIGGATRIFSTTASTSPSTGSLLVAGGLGVSGQLSFVNAALGFTGITTNPSMAFIGATSSAPITLTVQTDNSLSWEGNSGQLFSIDNNLSSGEIFSVSDISGLPVISASAGQTINLNEFGGYTQIGNGTINSSSTTSGSLVIAGGLGMSGNAFIGGTTTITNTTASTSSSTGALVVAGGAGIARTLFVGGNINLTGVMNSGTNTFSKNISTGDIALDNGTFDTPAILFYWGNNRNLGIDAFYAGSGTTRFRIVRELNESGGAELWSVDRNGIVTRSAWDVGEVINTRVYNNSDLSMSATTTINSTTYTNIATITYTPKSSTSHLWIEFDAHYDFSNGTTTDDFFSRITVGGSAIVEKNQIMVGQVGGGTRSGTIFPISGRYTNSSTSGIAITVQAKWGSADDAIRVYGSSTSGYMRIQEIGR